MAGLILGMYCPSTGFLKPRLVVVSVFKFLRFCVHITKMRFCLATFSFSPGLSAYSFGYAKPKTELKISALMQKRFSVKVV